MRLHARTQPVAKAKAEIALEFWKQVDKADLTYGEIAGLLAELLGNAAKYMVRQERHPGDPDAKGDEA